MSSLVNRWAGARGSFNLKHAIQNKQLTFHPMSETEQKQHSDRIEQSSGRRRKILLWTAVGIGCLLILLGAAGGVLWLQFQSLFVEGPAGDKTSEVSPDTSLTSAAEKYTSVDKEKLKTKHDRFMQSLASGKNATFRFSGNELGAMVNTLPQYEHLQDKLTLDIRDNLLFVQGTVPAEDLPKPASMFVGKGEKKLPLTAGLEVNYKNESPQIYARKLRIRNKKVPGALMNTLKDVNLAEKKFGLVPEDPRILKNLHSVHIRDNELVLRTGSSTQKTSSP
mgnify:CR=1 FL=1